MKTANPDVKGGAHHPTAASDAAIAAALRKDAMALAEAIPEKIEGAPLNQLAAALKTVVDVIRTLELPHDSTQEQIIRWEFVYDGAVRDAPPWADGGDAASGPVPRGGVRAAVGQDGIGQSGAA